jgi:hypothetical protein
LRYFLAVLFTNAFGRLGHIPYLQILNTDERVVLADRRCGFVQEILSGVSDAGMNLTVRKLVVPDLEQPADFVVVRSVKHAVAVAIFDAGNGSQSPSELASRMEAPDGNALALTRQGECITMSTVHPFNRSALWLQPLKLNPP